ncbi:MAG TPA: hypothetical protein PLC67_00725, partial [Spirochaetota bacterium]|nr:hypothetical protein [Spirochaetota bacterium]
SVFFPSSPFIVRLCRITLNILKLKVCRRQTNIDRRAGVLFEPNPPCLQRRFGEFCATRAARQLSDNFSLVTFFFCKKKVTETGKGRVMPFEVCPTLGPP